MTMMCGGLKMIEMIKIWPDGLTTCEVRESSKLQYQLQDRECVCQNNM